MIETVVLDGDCTLLHQIDGDLSIINEFSGDIGVYMPTHSDAYPAYTGQTEITPAAEEQRLETAYKSVLEEIVIKPIPNNYGLITWDGSTITVS